MTAREQLIEEIEQLPDLLVEEVLDFLLFKKARQKPSPTLTDEADHVLRQSVLDRMGGVPQHLLAVGHLSDRETRRAILASRIQKSHQQQ